ncbi:hypothetical protein [Flavobacterium beibuense]|uniref:Uncharacterized protein n=1 Tax=Flavobacterium beibuense TaxID=657326 RepID=A0A444WAE4_9FLAO|nr:hypothetical protein [Flavobacterium beibuense]RYJ42850.1 hypothetical protein NU09_1949 [Flavobacterium beibuense]
MLARPDIPTRSADDNERTFPSTKPIKRQLIYAAQGLTVKQKTTA